jgi:hypothetical protein
VWVVAGTFAGRVRLTLIDLWPALGRDDICYMVDDWLVTFAPALFGIAALIYWFDRALVCAAAPFRARL